MKRLLLLFLVTTFPFIAESRDKEAATGSQTDTTEIVEINGIKQFLSIKGNDTAQPILLFLHGGPGISLTESSESFSDKLKDAFIIVNWDQRETGQTLKLNGTSQPLTADLMTNDAYKVILYLLKTYNRKKLYLVSHSWGSVLGFNIAAAHPELLYAYVGISAIVDQRRSEELTLAMLKDWASERQDTTAINELEQVKLPIERENDLFLSQKWLFIKNGVDFAREDGFKTNYYKWMNTWFPVWKASVRNTMFDRSKSFGCPVYFIEGNADKYKSHYLVEDYYNYIKAPEKGFYWMEKSGHTVFNTEPDKLQEIIIGIKKETM